MNVNAENPFHPGYGGRPHTLAGRSKILRDLDRMLDEFARGRAAERARVLIGPRGVGKTSLLVDMAEKASAATATRVIQVEVGSGGLFVDELVRIVGRLDRTSHSLKTARITSAELEAKLGPFRGAATVDFAQEPPASRFSALRDSTAALLERLGDDGAVLFLVDEIHLSNRDEQNAIGQLLQAATRTKLRIGAVFAGLNKFRDRQESTTYLRERARWHEVDIIDRQEAVRALREPAADSGRPFTDEALSYLARRAGTYPFAIQIYGYYAWERSVGQSEIDIDSAVFGAEDAFDDMRDGFFNTRWTDAGPTQQPYLGIVALLQRHGKQVKSRDVADFLGVPIAKLSMAREGLLSRGYLHDESGVLKFVVPDMGDDVLERWQHELGVAPDELESELRAAAAGGLAERSSRYRRSV